MCAFCLRFFRKILEESVGIMKAEKNSKQKEETKRLQRQQQQELEWNEKMRQKEAEWEQKLGSTQRQRTKFHEKKLY